MCSFKYNVCKFPFFQLRNFLESSLLELKESWMKRLTYYTCVECPCGRPCYLHGNDACKEEGCLHFLDLDECLATRVYSLQICSFYTVLMYYEFSVRMNHVSICIQVVCCEHRRVKTTSIKQWFPETRSPGKHQHLPILLFSLILCFQEF